MASGGFLAGLRRWLTPAVATPLSEAIRLPAHVLNTSWQFDAPSSRMEWDVTVHVDPGSSTGEYLGLFNGTIDGSSFYLGMQTNMSNPALGRGVGKGLIFSTWWSFDEADIRVAPGGYREMGTHEGRFIGVRQTYPWTTGDYRVALARAEADGDHDWFELTITPTDPPMAQGDRSVATGPTELIGALRFPRRSPGEPARIDAGGAVLFMEVYGSARTWADVDRWDVDVMAYADGTRCPSGGTKYPAFPYGQVMPNANIRYEPERERVVLQMGGDVEVTDRPADWR